MKRKLQKIRGGLGEYQPAPSLPQGRPAPKPGFIEPQEPTRPAPGADLQPIKPGPRPEGPEPWKNPCFWSCPHYQAKRVFQYKPSGTLITHGAGYIDVAQAIVNVPATDVFFWEHVGLGWSAGASGWLAFTFIVNKGTLDGFRDIAALIGGLNPADYYPIRRVIPGPAEVKIWAANTHAGLDFTAFALISGWRVPKIVRG